MRSKVLKWGARRGERWVMMRSKVMKRSKEKEVGDNEKDRE